MSDEVKEFVFKIVVLGDAAVGKTSLINQYIEQTFLEDYRPTLGVNIISKDIEIKQIGSLIRLIFWDIAGQDDFNFLHHLFYKESKAAIIVYSLEENELGQKSFTHIKNWHEVVEKNCGDIPFVLFANKVDLVDENSLITTKVQKLVNEHKFLNFFFTSAKTGQGVIEAFNAIIERLYLKFKNF